MKALHRAHCEGRVRSRILLSLLAAATLLGRAVPSPAALLTYTDRATWLADLGLVSMAFLDFHKSFSEELQLGQKAKSGSPFGHQRADPFHRDGHKDS